MLNFPSSSPPLIDHETASSATIAVTDLWFSFTETAELASPALPLGPVITGGIVSRKITLVVWVKFAPSSSPVIETVPTELEEVSVAV